MRRRALLLGLVATPAAADELLEAIVSLFHERLEPLGEWRDVPGMGQVWRPAGVAPGWRPFTAGRWRLTYEAGWFWQGDLPFSAITEHRGRWRLLDGEWWWVPGTRFDPAPVAWAKPQPGSIGWAPLPSGERPVEGWSVAPLRALAAGPVVVHEPAGDPGRRVAPPDPLDVEAAGGPPIAMVSLGDLVDADDLTAWYAVDTRSVFGVGNPALRLPRPGPTPRPSGPNAPDSAWKSFERQRQLNLRENERLREAERRRDNNELR